MVGFHITENNEIELMEYDAGTTLADLAAELESFRAAAPDLRTGECKGCGECCSDDIPVLGLDLAVLPGIPDADPGQAVGSILILPDKPDMDFRRKAIREMCEWTNISELEATLLFEYNNAEPLILARQASGECCFLKDGLCTRYTMRPYSCGLYLCNMGPRLAYIQEMIIRQGTWHAYSKLGWISKSDIPHNPFLKADSYDKLLVSDFEFDLKNTSEQLFFYF